MTVPACAATYRRVPSPPDWLVLLKPRVVSLVVFTGLVGVLVAPGHLHPVLAVRRDAVHRGGAPARPAPSTCGTTATSTR